MSLGHGANIVRDGLVLYLDAANVKSYPGSGTTWTDLSGKGNNGTLLNGVGYNSQNNGSLIFDMSNDYINCGNDASLRITNNSLTMEAVFKTSYNVVDIDGNALISKRYSYGTGNGSFMMWHKGDYLVSTIETSTQAYSIDTNGLFNIADGEPHIACVTYDGSNIKVYIDGELIKSTSASGTILDQDVPLSIGAGRAAGNIDSDYYFNGNIYSAKIYNRGLSSEEVEQNFNALQGRYGIGLLTPVIEPPAATDPYWNNVVWLSSFDNTVTNEANTSATIALYNGASFSTTQTKFGSHSVFSDGTTQMIGLEGGRDIATNEPFTIESWFYPTASVVGTIVFGAVSGTDIVAGGSAGTYLWFYSSTSYRLYVNGSIRVSGFLDPDVLVPQNQWNHIAITRDTNNLVNFWVNGNLVGQSSPYSNSINADYWRVNHWGGGTQYGFTGYIDELRFTYGVDRYTTPFEIQQPTMTNDPLSTQTTLLLNFEGADGSASFTDESDFNHTVTVLGDAQVDTTIAQYGSGSLLLDGVGDGLRVPSTNILPGTGDFTIELAVYPNVITNWQCLCQIGNYNANGGFTLISGDSQTRMEISGFTYNTTALVAGQWNTIVVQRASGLLYVWIDGLLKINGSSSTTNINNASPLEIGYSSGASGVDPVNGYIDGFRFTTGAARYDVGLGSTYTVPTEAFPAQ